MDIRAVGIEGFGNLKAKHCTRKRTIAYVASDFPFTEIERIVSGVKIWLQAIFDWKTVHRILPELVKLPCLILSDAEQHV